MKQVVIAGVVIFVIWVGILFGASVLLSDGVRDFEEMVGRRVVLEGDTLLVTNFSLTSGSYSLSNGVEVSEKLLPEILVERSIKDMSDEVLKKRK